MHIPYDIIDIIILIELSFHASVHFSLFHKRKTMIQYKLPMNAVDH